jgi:transcriptional regulator with GAF, ATPase, and Fis domain
MGGVEQQGHELSDGQPYRTLLAVSEAIVSQRDLASLFGDLAGRLHPVVRFDYLACLLHDATSNTLCSHLLESAEPVSVQAPRGAAVRLGMKRSSLQNKMKKLGICRSD